MQREMLKRYRRNPLISHSQFLSIFPLFNPLRFFRYASRPPATTFLYLCLQNHFVVLLVAGFVDGADAGADIP